MNRLGALLILLLAAFAVERSHAEARVYFQELLNNGTIAIRSVNQEGGELRLHALLTSVNTTTASIPFAVVERMIFAAWPSPHGDSLLVFSEQGKNKTLLKNLGRIRGLTADETGRLWWLKCNPHQDQNDWCKSVEVWSVDPKASPPKPLKQDTLDELAFPIAFDVNSQGELAVTGLNIHNESVVIVGEYTYTQIANTAAGGIAIDEIGDVYFAFAFDELVLSFLRMAPSGNTDTLCNVYPYDGFPPSTIAVDTSSTSLFYHEGRGLYSFEYDPLPKVCGQQIFLSAQGVVSSVTVAKWRS
ncbi:hypothetical protein QOT17_013453 [Balamuthia mandrillaris]